MHGTTGAWTFVGVSGTGSYTLSGGSFSEPNRLEIGQNNGTGTFTQSGALPATSTATVGAIVIGGDNGTHGIGTYNLNGGTLITGQVTENTAGGTSTFNFNGGTLKPSVSTTTFMLGLSAANVQNGGAIIDTNNFNATISQNLLNGGSGGLAKNGAGTLTLSGANTYVGLTTITAGTLSLGSAGALGGGGNITFSGGTLQYSSSNTADYSAKIVNSVTSAAPVAIDLNGQQVTWNSGLAASNTSGFALNNSAALGNTGKLTMTAGSSFTGGMAINSGRLYISNGNALGTTNAVSMINGTAGDPELHLTNGITVPSGVTFTTSNTTYNGSIVNESGSNAINGPVVLTTGGGDTVLNSIAGTLTMAGNISDNTAGRTLQLWGAGAGAITGNISDGTSPLSVSRVVAGANASNAGANGGVWTIAGAANSYSGATTISTGQLRVTGTISATSNLFVTPGGSALIDTGGSVTTTAYSSIGQTAGTAATLTVQSTGAISTPSDFNISDQTGSIGVLNISGSAAVKVKNLFVGKTGTAQGYVTQTGGALSPLGTPATDWRIGGGGSATDAASVGVYTMSGGTFSTPINLQIGAFGTGAMLLSGNAAVTITGQTPVVGRFQGGYGLLDVAGTSTFTNQTTNTRVIIGESGVGILNVRGGTVTAASTAPTLWLGSSEATAGNIGIANLLSGTLNVPSVGTGSASDTSIFNFNGGKLQANAAGSTFMQGLTAAYVYSGNAIVDTQANNVTIAQALLAPTGNGVNAVTVSTAGSGYVSAPVVKLSGTGVGATAIATMSGGTISGFIVTNPGTGYTSAPTVTLVGGNPTTAATLPVATTATNISGGLTKTGSGTLTLSGANTYSGATNINVGTLALSGSVNNIASSPTINISAGATTGASLSVSGIGGLILNSQTVSATGTGTGAGAAQLTGGLTVPAGSLVTGNFAAQLAIDALNFNGGGAGFSLAGTYGGTPLVNVTTSGAFTVTSATPIAITAPQLGTFELFGYNGSASGLANLQQPTGPSAYLYNLNTGTAGQVNLVVTVNNNNVTWAGQTSGSNDENWTTSSANQNWATGIGQSTQYNDGTTVTFLDANPLGGAAPTGIVTIQSSGVAPLSATFSNSSTKTYTVNSVANTGTPANSGIYGSASVVVNGGGTVRVTGPNTYSGATNIQSGTMILGTNAGNTSTGSIGTGTSVTLGNSVGNTVGVLQLGDATNPVNQTIAGLSTSGSGANAVVGGNASISTLNLNSASANLYTGAMGGTGSNQNNLALTMSGGGSLTLAGSNTYTGLTTVANGTVALGSSLPSTNSAVLGDGGTNAGVLQLGTSAGPLAQTLASLTSSGSGTSAVVGGNAANSTLTINATGTDNYGGLLGGAGSNQNKLALSVTSGTLALSNSGSTYTGGTTVSGGSILSIAADGALGSAPASPAINLTLNNGTLRITAPLTLAANRSIVLNGTGFTSGDVIDTQGNAIVYAGAFSGTGGLNVTGAGGSITYTGTSTAADLILHQGSFVVGTGGNLTTSGVSSFGFVNGDVGTITVQSTGQLTVNNDFNVSDGTGSIGILNISGTAAVSGKTLYVGKSGNSQGYVNQTGGSFAAAAGGAGEWRIGGGGNATDAAAVGVYNISGGTFVTPDNLQIGAFGSGEMNVSGAGAVTSNNAFPSVGRWTGGFGVLDVSGGSFTANGNGNVMLVGELGTGVVNVRGGSVSVGSTNATIALSLGHGAGSNGMVNLLGGTLSTLSVGSGAGHAATSTLNFNGGMLQATASNGAFVQNLTNAYVYGGGGTIDTQAFNVTINQALTAPAGSGVSAVGVGVGGTGYVSAPVVQITGGGGTGATAVASMSGGAITGITITNPGVGYTSTPTVTLLGGNPTAAASLSPATTAVNTSGGLTKVGSGTLTLTAQNTYGGGTTISGGTLRLSPGLAHRYSFTSGSLTDAVGGQNAAIVTGTSHFTSNATSITLPGGGHAASDYINLGAGLVPTNSGFTVETWATPVTVQNWSRIFDTGSSTTNNYFASWSVGTNGAKSVRHQHHGHGKLRHDEQHVRPGNRVPYCDDLCSRRRSRRHELGDSLRRCRQHQFDRHGLGIVHDHPEPKRRFGELLLSRAVVVRR